MPEYIERDEILAQIEARKKSIEAAVNCNYRAALSDVCKIVADIPAADVVEVRHGYWKAEPVFARDFESGNAIYTQYECSECGRVERNIHPYCHCGAKMDGEQKDGGSDE